jgi:hypothetical protein
MTYFCETSDIDLSGVNLEQLFALKKQLKETNQFLTTERIKAVKAVRDLEKELKKIDDNLKIILKEIKHHEDIDEAKNMINENIKNIENFNILNGEEVLLITKKMDRTDYRNYGDYPRWIDFEKICKEVIQMKKRYPNWLLTDLEKSTKINTVPPQSSYFYKFKDEFADYFILEVTLD